MKLQVLFLLTIVVYTVFHVTEETIGNFPRFMQENWGIPDIGYGQWLYHNMVFFLPVLLSGFVVFLIDEEKFFHSKIHFAPLEEKAFEQEQIQI